MGGCHGGRVDRSRALARGTGIARDRCACGTGRMSIVPARRLDLGLALGWVGRSVGRFDMRWYRPASGHSEHGVVCSTLRSPRQEAGGSGCTCP